MFIDSKLKFEKVKNIYLQYFSHKASLVENSQFSTRRDLALQVISQVQANLQSNIKRKFMVKKQVNENKVNTLFSIIQSKQLMPEISKKKIMYQLIQKYSIKNQFTKVVFVKPIYGNIKFLLKRS